MSMSDPAVTVCFVLKIDGKELASFTTCEGLGVEITVEKREEGGNNDYVHQLPGRMSYSNIKFTRPIDSDSPKVAQWIARMAATRTDRHTASIQAKTADDTVICTWNLQDVIPVKWTGPQFGVDSPKVATETVELAHHGFLPGS